MAYPSDLDTLTDASLGRTKIDEPGKAVRSLAYDVPAAEHNAYRQAIIELETTVGLPTGATASSVWEALLRQQKMHGYGIQTLTGTGTVSATTAVCYITPGGPGAVTVTLPDLAGLTVPRLLVITRTQAPGGTTLTRAGTDTIFDDITNTSVTSFAPRDSSQVIVSWLLVGASGVWRVYRMSSPSELASAVTAIGATDGSTADSIWQSVRGGGGRGYQLLTATGAIAQSSEIVVAYMVSGTVTLPPQPVSSDRAKHLLLIQITGATFNLACDSGDTTPTINGESSPITLPAAGVDTFWDCYSAAGSGWQIRRERISATEDISGASATLGTADESRVTYAGGACALTLPVSTIAWRVGETKRIRKENTSTFGITLTPNTGGSINGAAADATMTLPGSSLASGTTRGDMWWDVTRLSTTAWRVAGGGARLDASGNLDLGAGNVTTSGTVDGRDVSVDGAKLDLVTSGTWTPTATGVTNCDSVTGQPGYYLRIGNYVSFGVRVDVDPTAATNTVLQIPLPAGSTSNFGAATDAVGVANGSQISLGRAYADAATDTVEVAFLAAGTTSTSIYVEGHYRVLP